MDKIDIQNEPTFDILVEPENNTKKNLDEKIDGIELSVYAEQQDLSVHDVWERIKSGELIARIADSKIFVYETELMQDKEVSSPNSKRMEGASFAGSLPPLPTFSEDELNQIDLEVSYSSSQTFLPQTSPQSVELSLLLDHLSLAKEEQRDLIKMTQNTIEKISKMTELALESKTELLNHRNHKIEELENRIRKNEETISKLKQEVEDLEILNKQLSSEF